MAEASPTVPTQVIETRGLTKRYGASRGIEDVSMGVAGGEVFGFLGPNGAGKTTTIRTLLDLLRPTSGTATIFGLDTRRDSLAIRARIGNLPGDFSVDEHLTGRELLRFCADVRGMDGLGRADALAERFAADLDRPLGELSRGNRQKIGLIQATFHEPELLILDEPTGGLDPIMQEEFLRLVEEHRDGGGTVFMSSHELDEVQRVCNRVAIIREGRLAAVEDVATLRGRDFRRVRITFADGAAARELALLPAVSDARVEGAVVSFQVAGGLDAVVKAAARHEVVDLDVTEPTLEEIFLRFYGREHGA